jgi:hypothetical protein
MKGDVAGNGATRTCTGKLPFFTKPSRSPLKLETASKTVSSCGKNNWHQAGTQAQRLAGKHGHELFG